MQRDSYLDSGFDEYLTRSIDGYINTTLGNAPLMAGSQQIAFDRNQVTGAIGDKVTIGQVVIDGVTGRIAIYDVTGTEIGRIGNIDD